MNTHNTPEECPLLAVTGRSGAGKTTLLTALLPRLREAGLRVAAVKQARADFEVDRRGKDSWRLRKAGAAATPAPAGEDAWLLAVATDRPAELVASVPVLDLDDACEIEGFVLGWSATGSPTGSLTASSRSGTRRC